MICRSNLIPNKRWGHSTVHLKIGLWAQWKCSCAALKVCALIPKTERFSRKLENHCRVCKKVSFPPQRFTLTVRTQKHSFIRRVRVDTMYRGRSHVVYIADEATHYFLASFLCYPSTKEIMKAIHQMWCLIYAGLPDYLILHHRLRTHQIKRGSRPSHLVYSWTRHP